MGSSATAPARTRPATQPRGPARVPLATTAPAASNVSAALAARRPTGVMVGKGEGLQEPPTPGSWPLPPQGAHQGGLGLAVSCCVGVSTGALVTWSLGPAAAPLDSLGLTAASVSGWGVFSLPLDRQGHTIRPAGQTAPDRATPWVPRWDWLQTRLSWGIDVAKTSPRPALPGWVLCPRPGLCPPGALQKPAGVLPREGPLPESRGDFPTIWGWSWWRWVGAS